MINISNVGKKNLNINEVSLKYQSMYNFNLPKRGYYGIMVITFKTFIKYGDRATLTWNGPILLESVHELYQ